MGSRYSPWWRCAVAVGAFLAVLVWAPVALATGDASEQSCVNESLEGFTTYLPDCRAYEMVTPSFEGGVRSNLAAISEDGSRILGNSLGVFAGAKSDYGTEGALYELSRTGAGWVASAIGPPASEFGASTFFAASSDLDKTLWQLRGVSQSLEAQDLYVREPGGALVQVGPMAPPSATWGPPVGEFQEFFGRYFYAGASDDLSHVLFAIEHGNGGSMVWPGDTTASAAEARGISLYEYVGRGNRRPGLVGVSDGTTVVDGKSLAAGKLISNCETRLGAEEGHDTYNAVSKSGETVFFSAQGHSIPGCGSGLDAPEVSELYARLDGVETVSISEPSSGQCGECSTETKAPAVFQGASRDGSKAFFLTEQELLPGAATMNLYEYDFDNPLRHKVVRLSIGSGAPEVLGVARVSQDGSHVYFVAKGQLTVGKNSEGREPVVGGANLYVFERDATYLGGHLAFIGTLQSPETEVERTQKDEMCDSLNESEQAPCRASVSKEFELKGLDAQDWSVNDVRPVQGTPDGRFVVFPSTADLTSGDTSNMQQIFEYDALKEELARVSVGQVGYAEGAANADAAASTVSSQAYTGSFSPSEASNRLAISTDGSKVVFGSVGALTANAEPAAAAGAESVYEYHSASSLLHGDVSLISDGLDVTARIDRSKGADPLAIDASGQDVFFQTADRLLDQDGNAQFDIYDARSSGGFSAPASQTGCESESCQGTWPPTPQFTAPSSTSGSPESDVTPSVSPGGGGKSAVKQLTRRQRLARALRTCRRTLGKRRRHVCEARARKRYRRPLLKSKGRR